MSTETDAKQADAFRVAQRRLAGWRKERRRGERMPGDLWHLAVELAAEHGVSRTSQRLRLDYYRLKERLATAGASRAQFVEVAVMPHGGGCQAAVPECVVEYEDGRGARLRIELRGAATGQVEALALALRGTAA